MKALFGLLKKNSFLTMCMICVTTCILVCMGFLIYHSYIALGGPYRTEAVRINPCSGQGEAAVFRDEVFEKALRDAWGNPGKKIYINELKNCTELVITGQQDLTDISDLALFPGLEKLTISNGKISDISVLSELKNLTYLDLSNNRISDMSPLSELSALEKLDLTGNRIAELPENIGRMQMLLELNLTRNYLSGIGGLSGLPMLSVLRVQNNPLSSLNATKPFPALLTLDLTGCPIQTIQSLDKFSLLEELIVSWTKIENLDFMKNNESLISLDISYTRVQDLSILAGCEKLEGLKLYGFNQIDLAPLKLLPMFNSIYLNYNYDRSEIDFLIGNYKTGDLQTITYLCGNKNRLIG